MGEASHVAPVVPDAVPSVRGLRHKPVHAACRRFLAAAGWFQALLQGEILPFERIGCAHVVATEFGLTHQLGEEVQRFSAQANRRNTLPPVERGHLEEIRSKVSKANILGAHDDAVALACHLSVQEIITVRGDTRAALADAVHLKGKEHINPAARELARRKVRAPVAALGHTHLPAEQNGRADDLSRLHAIPLQICSHVRAPDLLSLWFAWVADARVITR